MRDSLYGIGISIDSVTVSVPLIGGPNCPLRSHVEKVYR